MNKFTIGICCYNEEENVLLAYNAIVQELKEVKNAEFEIIFADNCSTDNTQEILRGIASRDKRVKVIINQRNYGVAASGFNLFKRCTGDAYIGLPCDLQEPAEMIPEFISEWKKGFDAVLGQKKESEENKVKFFLRTVYYKIIKRLSPINQHEHITGFGIYSKWILDERIKLEDPNLSMRHVVMQVGAKIKLIPYKQKKRINGKSSYNISRYFEFAMRTLINTSFAPLRFITITGLISSGLCFGIAMIYLIYKLVYWENFTMGIAPLIIGMFFIGSVQLLSLGIIGEYIGVILQSIKKQPEVIEKELLNFYDDNNLK